MTGDDFREIALGLDGVMEQAHMNHPDFRTNGRIFASLLGNEQRAGLNLSADEQREFLDRYPGVFEPASGAWGRRGWTVVDLQSAEKAVVRGAVLLAYARVNAQPRRKVRPAKAR
jgi:hypothetical protein